MTSGDLRLALCVGYECMTAWADVLDQINLFPVADGDTGRNLVLSLAPLRETSCSENELVRKLMLSARGNSGNIAVEYVRHLVADTHLPLHERLAISAERARNAVANPVAGTMLTVFDTLAERWTGDVAASQLDDVVATLIAAVRSTTNELEVLREAQVVDSGALGMLVFLDGFVHRLKGIESSRRIAREFGAMVDFKREQAEHDHDHTTCIDAVLRVHRGSSISEGGLRELGDDVVILSERDTWKVHLHTSDPKHVRERLEGFGEVLRWSWDSFEDQGRAVRPPRDPNAVHIVTDGAASVSRDDAEKEGITLLDNYVNLGDLSIPETRLTPSDAYSAMRRGVQVSTSQASVFERERRYARIAEHHERALYLSVGSVYTGNFSVAQSWAADHQLGERLDVVDTGAASGRLGVLVWAAARRARKEREPQALLSFVERALDLAEEYIFLDTLEYLARGGRVSKTKARLAGAVGLTPVVSPMPDGARQVKILRKLDSKLAFAWQRLSSALAKSQGRGLILLQHTDNERWVRDVLYPTALERFPHAECRISPLSMTTGVHTGPGTWAVAVLPELEDPT